LGLLGLREFGGIKRVTAREEGEEESDDEFHGGDGPESGWMTRVGLKPVLRAWYFSV
jgi:hypothetical protein